MNFKAKLSKQGNSYCIYVPVEVRTKLDLTKEYEWEVRTGVEMVGIIDSKTEQISFNKSSNLERCSKHNGSYKGTCGCT